MSIFHRGNPEPDDVVHLNATIQRPHMDPLCKVLCLNGAYHTRQTNNPNQVTCPACLAKMKEERMSLFKVTDSAVAPQ